jgi:hypothetical protein
MLMIGIANRTRVRRNRRTIVAMQPAHKTYLSTSFIYFTIL